MNVNLAAKIRPASLDNFIGQDHLVGPGKPIRTLLEKGKIHSMIFWGPPGCGKTTLAKIIPSYIDAEFVPYSAVTGNIKEVREIIKTAKELKEEKERETVLFIDEIHRFNKAQQDAFLPHVEDGTIILIGATTENPGFSVISPLLSRSTVYRFNPLNENEIKQVIKGGTDLLELKLEQEAITYLVNLCGGDARKVLNALELLESVDGKEISKEQVETTIQQKLAVYDKKGDGHYDTISAFIKSMRGGDADATLHYLARMIDAGEDPMFIARRMVIFASEDIGNAKPNALVLATSTMQAVKMIGMPEATLLLSQCATYLATCPKSIAVTMGIGKAMSDLKKKNPGPIPLHLRNAANSVMKAFGYAKNHTRYPWLEQKNGKKVEQDYLPDNLSGIKYYDLDKFSE